ncbi:hypothetical protein [Gymnodinialimonas hymeniacidonis]|uniref:hypothetical protein n=1 Tax=Gymnodinialimonas hymeniacidonis TaxID=3126508 RepID=UPI0034C622E8
MTLKHTLLGTVALVALSGAAFAQSTDTDTETDAEVVVETPVVDAETDTDAETDMDTDEDAEAAADADMDTETETESDLATAGLITDRDVRDTSMFSGMTVGDIIGMDVHSIAGEDEDDVGEIDYIIETADGYEAVIGIGGFLGLGEYTVALPLGAFSMGGDETLLLDGFTEEELEAMPETDESDLEALPDDHVIG